MSDSRSEFGMIGLGTMGRALLQNIADHGFAVSGFNRNRERLELLLEEAKGTDIQGFNDLEQFVQSIRKPRVVMLLVPAGEATDEMIDRVLPLLEPGDFIIDGSNAHYKDTDRRSKALAGTGLGFLGLGVSGGESGARRGPSMMAGGTPENYERVRSMLEAAAAKYNCEPCVALLGPSSAGHYVKMVHNGIEYGIMQILAECYDVMSRGLGLENELISDVFAHWNSGEMQSFLLEITAHVLKRNDEETGESLVDLILDKAKSKGTGKWTSQDAMDLGVAIPTIDAAVSARQISSLKEERQAASLVLAEDEWNLGDEALDPDEEPDPLEIEELELEAFGDVTVEEVIEPLEAAMTAATVIAYAQGLAMLRAASAEYGYGLDLQEVAKVWRAGCIVRSQFLEEIRKAYSRNADLPNLLVDPYVTEMINRDVDGLRRTVVYAVAEGLPVPALSASLAYLDGYRSADLPANLTQAQRDLFGAHTYERIDQEGAFHTEWGYE